MPLEKKQASKKYKISLLQFLRIQPIPEVMISSRTGNQTCLRSDKDLKKKS